MTHFFSLKLETLIEQLLTVMIVKMNTLYRYCHRNRNNGLIQSLLKSMSPELYYSDFRLKIFSVTFMNV